MDFTMKRPCDMCPFVRNGLRLSKDRARMLGGQIVDERGMGGTSVFPCHKTADVNNIGDFVAKSEGTLHCAGALIFAEKQNAPTQMMQVASRLRFYDRTQLDMTADVFDNLQEMIDNGW